jgi:hypothetical protein
LVELTQVGRRHDDAAHRRGLLRAIQRWHRRGLGRPAPHAQQEHFDVVARRATARLDHALHPVDGVLLQQLQDANVVLDTAAGAVLLLQGFAQFAEHRRQLPAAKDVGVIQRRRPALQAAEVVLGIEDLLVPAVATRMRGDHLAAEHHVNAVDGRLDGDGLESSRARHAVAVIVETHHLVLVGLGGLDDTRMEALLGE